MQLPACGSILRGTLLLLQALADDRVAAEPKTSKDNSWSDTRTDSLAALRSIRNRKSRPLPLAMLRKYPPDSRTTMLRRSPGTPRTVTRRADSIGSASWMAAPTPRVRHCRRIVAPASLTSRNSFPPWTSVSSHSACPAAGTAPSSASAPSSVRTVTVLLTIIRSPHSGCRFPNVTSAGISVSRLMPAARSSICSRHCSTMVALPKTLNEAP